MARPTTALIVDDEAHVRTFLRLLLRETGIETCWEAADGGTALAMVAQHNPELILLDLNLPVMGGLEVLAKIGATQPEIPMVIVTSQSAMSTVQEAVRLGAAGYMLKHNPRNEARAALRELLDSMGDEADEPGPA